MKQLYLKPLLIGLLTIATLPSFAYDCYVDGIYYNLNETNHTAYLTYSDFTYVELSGYILSYQYNTKNTISGTVNIPSSITIHGDTYVVTYIGSDAFADCQKITSVTIPESVTSIGVNAFRDCTSLTSVVIPKSVTSIDNEAFGGTAWYKNQPDGLVYAGKVAYKYKGTMSEGTDIVIEDGTVSISPYAFSGCTGLTSVTIPEGVTSIRHHAFKDCTSLTSVTIPEGVTSIGDQAFYNCTGLTSVTIPEGVTSIDDYTFYCCTSLTSVTIPYNVKNIGGNAFYGCTNLTAMIVSVIDFAEFCNNNIYPSIRKPIKLIDKDGNEITEFNIPHGVTSIGSYAFGGCTGLTSVTIPYNVKNIGGHAFYGCTNLTITVSVIDFAEFCNNIIYSSIKKPIQLIDKDGNEITEFNIPHGVTSIGSYAFGGCTGLTSVTIPEGVTSIGNSAFQDCTGLTSVTIPDSVTSIGDYAFRGCTGLTSMTFGRSVEAIGQGVFQSCFGLKNVTINSNPLMQKFYYDSDKRYYTCASIFGTDVEEYIIGDGVTTIGSHAFRKCTGMKSITIHEHVTAIGTDVFYGCSNLTNVNVPVQDYATFCNNSIVYLIYSRTGRSARLIDNEGNVIKEYIIPDGVTAIGNNAFYGCKELTLVIIPDGVKTITYQAFQNCSDLTSVIIPSSVTSIGKGAFSGCTSLASVNIPPNISSLSHDSFNESCKFYVDRGSLSLLEIWKIMGPNIEGEHRRKNAPYETGTENRLEPPTLTLADTTQTKATFKWSNIYDEYSYSYDYNEYYTNYYYTGTYHYKNSETVTVANETVGKTKDEFTVDVLPEDKYTIRIYARLGDRSYEIRELNGQFAAISPTTTGVCTASSIHAHGEYIKGDAEVISQNLQLYKNRESNGYYSDLFAKSEENEGSLVCTGLDPNCSFYARYAITVQCGEKQRTYTNENAIKFSTSELKLTTIQPKVISPGNVIVAAESNLDDVEEKVGFEWRRTDWTDDFESNSGGAYLFEGEMEGYIKNLNTEKLWKFRPYYESNTGTRYYGEWVGIDPTNTSYFEPTVHTYSQQQVEGNTAQVKGYAMRGSDNVAQQGFMYWKQEAEVKAESSVNIPKNAQTIEAKGTVMQAELTGLDYESTYCYVAFMTTSEGETFYGEMQSFQTGEDPDGIGDIAAETSKGQPTIIARYDLNGRRIQQPHQGINILRMSDGTVRKILVK